MFTSFDSLSSLLVRLVTALLTAIMLLGLTACQSMGPHNIPAHEYESFTPLPESQRIMNNVRIKWEVREDVVDYCARAARMGREQAYLTPPVACAVWSVAAQECTVVTGPQVTHVALGHEVRHCFEGRFH
jgi:hypothetical protein